MALVTGYSLGLGMPVLNESHCLNCGPIGKSGNVGMVFVRGWCLGSEWTRPEARPGCII